MEHSHIKLQFDRLKRHHANALEDRDAISFLDLAHSLRIWVDMKNEIDELVSNKDFIPVFKNTQKNKEVLNILKGSKYLSVPLSSEVESPNIQVKGLHIIDRVLSPEEVKKLFEAGPPIEKPTNLSFSQWMGSRVLDVVDPQNTEQQKLSLSREILIKRVANILGASHPQGKEEFSELENRFDEPIKELHTFIVADGYPLTYYQLLEISGEIISSFEELFPTS